LTGKPGLPVIGVVRVAVGRAEGLAYFGRTVQSFLSSLAPLLAFPLAGAIIEFFRDGPLTALELVLLTLVLQLAPAVLSHALAVRWKREEQWLHYATAYNWCYWALPIVTFLLMMFFGLAIGAGLPETLGAKGVLAGLGIYSLWLHWFLARHALELTRWRAALLVIVVNVGTIVLAIGPTQLS
jgi:hypothetical protein